ncbi:MAG: diguanylate cyclase [Candidatus Firestonebacteria bacterium]|nr:diguanylate cyclase [Candidatus Firestonebacteria bacterium]
MKKNVIKLIIISIIISLIMCIIIGITGFIWIKQQTQMLNYILLKNFKAEVISHQNSDDMQKNITPFMENLVKNFSVSYLMVVNNSGEIVSHSNIKEIGRFYKDSFLPNILTQQKMINREAKHVYEEVYELGEPIHIQGLDGAIIIGISTNYSKTQKITLLFVLIGGFSLILIVSFIMFIYTDKKAFSSFTKLDKLCNDIASGKEIPAERYNISNDIKDITDSLKIVETKLHESSKNIDKYIIDNITEFYTFQYISERLHHELERAKRYKRDMSCILLDLSNWQNIFSLCGLEKCEFALLELANLLKSNLRSVDLKGKIDRSSFIFILPEINSNDAKIVAERLISIIKQYKIFYENKETSFSVNIGIKTYIPEKTSLDEKQFIKHAQEALRTAQMTGENQIYIINI